MQAGQKIASWVEYFRATDFESLFEELEKDLIDLPLLELSERKPEFLDFWTGLLRQIERARATIIVEKSKVQRLTVEEGAQLVNRQPAPGSLTQK